MSEPHPPGMEAVLLTLSELSHDQMTQVPLLPRRFVLRRQEDVSGVSGIGIVAEGVEFSDGLVVVQWLGRYRSTVVWREGIEAVLAVHGHDGRTTVVWIDSMAEQGAHNE